VKQFELDRRFPTDDTCLDFLKERSYPTGTTCPSCGKRSRFHRIARRSAYSCQYCGHHVYPTAGTIFHKSRTSLRLWFHAIELVRTSGDRLTARDLERELGVSYKTALRMHRQIKLLLDEDPDPLVTGDAVRAQQRARPLRGRRQAANRSVRSTRVDGGVARVSTQPRRSEGGAMRERFGIRNLGTRRLALSALLVVGIVVGVAVGVSQTRVTTHHASLKGAYLMRPNSNAFKTSLGAIRSGEPESGIDGPNQATYADQAYPALAVAPAQRAAAAQAAQRIKALPARKKATGWQLAGPSGVSASKTVAGESTAGTRGTVFSGRTTALAISPTCTSKVCPMLAGAAGGGVWFTPNAMAKKPKWSPSNGTIPSNAIGSIYYDPNDSTGQTVYVGTGEPNGSSDSEAGVGLFKSTDGGQTWSLVTGSTATNAPCAADGGATSTCPVATGNSIGAIAVDPEDPNTIYIGADVARHGSSSVNGGRFTPPGTSEVGVYRSTNGGATFDDVLIQPQDVVDPTNPTGGNFFRGGASHIEIDPATGDVYASLFDYGVYRSTDGTTWDQIFASAGGGAAGQSQFARTEFSLAPDGGNLRVYVGDASSGGSDFYTVANARGVAAATLLTGGTNGGWTKQSDSTNGTAGFGSFDYCQGQCSYDMPVASAPSDPDVVYIGGAMNYDEIFFFDGVPNRSNGRAVVRSEDDGASFTDMTIDSKGTSLHPDQHVIAVAPFDPNVAFIGNDGGIWRLDGQFADASAGCASRVDDLGPLTGDDLTDCQNWLMKIPKTISSLNDGLSTLQYQSLSVNPQKPTKDVIGGTQDNGTQATNNAKTWKVSVFGDGGQSGINPTNPKIRMHTYFNAQGDVNFQGTKETAWDWMAAPFFNASGTAFVEGNSFYLPLIADPKVGGTWFAGLQHVWRTQDNGGPQATLDAECNEFTGTGPFFGPSSNCGDWETLGGTALNAAGDLSGTFYGADKTPGSAGYVVATERAPSDNGTLWAGLRRGRVFVSTNADNATAGNVTFDRIDDATTPERFVSGIAVDPTNPNHAFISFSGYNAYATAAGTATGHVFDVTYHPGTHDATWTKIDHNLGDEPITDIVVDTNGDLYISTDFGVWTLPNGTTTWVPASTGLPTVAVYGLTIDRAGRVLYAATHGRSAWMLNLS
jgi:transposase-like protein